MSGENSTDSCSTGLNSQLGWFHQQPVGPRQNAARAQPCADFKVLCCNQAYGMQPGGGANGLNEMPGPVAHRTKSSRSLSSMS
jgi:hypothetical protein